MANLFWTGLPDIETLSLQACMKQSFQLVHELKQSPTILQINLELDRQSVEILVQTLKTLDAKPFSFGEKPFTKLANRLQEMNHIEDIAPEQYFFFVYHAVFTFFTDIAIQYTGTYSKNIADKHNRYFFFQIEECSIRPVFEKAIKALDLVSQARVHSIKNIDAEMPYFSSYVQDTHDLYMGNFSFLEELYVQLGDDISRQSMKMFLHKSIICQSLSATIAYPVPPPACTAIWRKDRLANPPALPVLEGASAGLIRCFHLHTFIYEQYAIEGLVEVQEGDIVIDAGAFIGDTTIYFAEKVGKTGKVYGFEVFEASALAAQSNVERNHCAEQCEIVAMALADKVKMLTFAAQRVASDNSTALNLCPGIGKDVISVQATTIDAFAKERNIPINFIKMDVEGAEMEIFEGAKDVIRQYKPTCAIAMYHKKDDILTIPRFLKNLNPTYTLYMRCEAEPVIFAIQNNT